MSDKAVFNAKTPKINSLFVAKKKPVEELESLLASPFSVYIDFANVRPWSAKLGWHVDPKRLMQFLESFTTFKEASFYQGELEGDKTSHGEIQAIKQCGYRLRTKQVKIMRIPINVTSIKSQSTDILSSFIRKSFLRKLDLETIEYLNGKIYELNRAGTYYIEDRKCNFDVEIGVDMLLDFERKKADIFCLWSGDSDFADPIRELLKNKKKVILFSTARKVSRELNDLKTEGLVIFEISKIRNFICWNKEIKL